MLTGPLDLHREIVRPDWVDYNNHMNVAYYVLVFDHATDVVLEEIGLDEEFRERTGSSVFVVESHVTYLDEAMQGEGLRVTSQILDSDDKRLHLFHNMYKDSGESVIATNELLILHVDLGDRRVAPFPVEIAKALGRMTLEHAGLPVPTEAGRAVQMRRKK